MLRSNYPASLTGLFLSGQNERNRWSLCSGMTGHYVPESVVTMDRNTQLPFQLESEARLQTA